VFRSLTAEAGKQAHGIDISAATDHGQMTSLKHGINSLERNNHPAYVGDINRQHPRIRADPENP
jgi:hypothetical protein